jgi:hypothetical protein
MYVFPEALSAEIAEVTVDADVVSGVNGWPQLVFMRPGRLDPGKFRSDVLLEGGRDPTHPRQVSVVQLRTGCVVVVHPVWRVRVQG